MPVFQCPIEGCAFQTDDVDTAVAAVLLTIHNNVHLSTPVSSNAGSHHRAPKLERPKISSGSSEETWNTFSTRWSMFKRSTGLSNTESLEQLFHCCDEDLRPRKKIGLFAKIRPGEIIFSPARRRKLSTFYFFEIHMKEHERILAMNYF